MAARQREDDAGDLAGRGIARHELHALMLEAPSPKPTRPRESAVVCTLVVAAAYAVAAACRVGWTWDGAFLFLRIVEDGVMPIPHQRWSNAGPMAILLWAREHVADLDVLAIVYGGAYVLLPVLALGTGLSMLRADAARMRIWIVVGVLFVPLPGVMCPTMEVTPCLQLLWPLLAWIWAGTPGRWLVPVLVLGLVLMGLHPAAGPLLAMVAMVAWWRPSLTPRDRAVAWACSALAGAHLVWTAARIDAYERSQLTPDAIARELGSVLLLAPMGIVALVGAWAWLEDRRGGELSRSSLAGPVWLCVLVMGLGYFHDAQGWSGSFNLRKFGVLVVAPFVWLAARQARRPMPTGPAPQTRQLLLPCVVFAVLLGLGSASWSRELERLRAVGDAAGERIVEPREIPGLVGTPLHHWSGTVTSILIQGYEPRWVLRAHDVEIDDEGIRLWGSSSEVALPFEPEGPARFDLQHLRP